MAHATKLTRATFGAVFNVIFLLAFICAALWVKGDIVLTPEQRAGVLVVGMLWMAFCNGMMTTIAAHRYAAELFIGGTEDE